MRPYATTRVRKITAKQRLRLAALSDIRDTWWRESEESGEPLICGICDEPITRPTDLDSDHIQPGKLGGCRDDSPANLQPAHRLCNSDKGSTRKPKTKAVPRKPGRIMNKTEIDIYLNAAECFCGAPKDKERPCCLECWARLADQLKLDLSRKGAELPTFAEYQELLQEVELQILSSQRKETA